MQVQKHALSKAWVQIAAVSLLILVFVLVLASCGTGAKSPRLRVTNGGDEPIAGLIVLFPEEEITFGDVAPGETTEYQVVSQGVYRYAAYRFQYRGETVTQPVLDWVGEVPMPGEAFTYVIGYDPTRPELQRVQLVEVIREQ